MRIDRGLRIADFGLRIGRELRIANCGLRIEEQRRRAISNATWTIRNGLFIAMLAGLLAGCTVGPDFSRPKADVQQQWIETNDKRVAGTEISGLWWKAFNDPVLDQLVQSSYQQNLPLQEAGLRILQARAQLGIAIGQQYPQQQEAFGSATGQNISRNAPNTFIADRSFYDFQVGFDATWELDFWGRFRRGVESAKASYIASVADYDDALVSLTAEVARTYTDFRTAQVLVKLAEENVKLQEEGLRLAEARFRHGATTELDVMQARTLLESTRSTIPGFLTQQRQAENALSTLLGRAPGTVDAILEGPIVVPAAAADVALGVPCDLLRRRPDVRRAELDAAAQSAKIGIAKTDLYPRIFIAGEIGYETSEHGGIQSHRGKFTNFFDNDSLFYSYGPGFHWNILNYGQITNNVRVQDALFEQLMVDYQNTVLTAAREVEDELISFLNAQDATQAEQKSVDAAKRSVELSFVQYREGAVDFQRVIDSQRSLLQEQNRLAQSQSNIATSLIALYKALGGGWEVRACQPIIPQEMQCQMRERTDWGCLLPPGQRRQELNPPPPARGAVPGLPGLVRIRRAAMRRPTYNYFCKGQSMANETESTLDNTKAPPSSPEDFDQLLQGIANQLANVEDGRFDDVMTDTLRQVAEHFGFDLGTIVMFREHGSRLEVTQRWAAPNVPLPPRASSVELEFPWSAQQFRQGHIIHITDVSQMPEEAARGKALMLDKGQKSIICIPLITEENVLGAICFGLFRDDYSWSQETVTRLRLVAEIVALGARQQQYSQAMKSLAKTVSQVYGGAGPVEQKGTSQLQPLAVRLMQVEQQERRRLGEIVHEDIMQLTASAAMLLERAGKRDYETIKRSNTRAAGILKEALQKLRQLATELRPQGLEKMGIVEGIRWLSRQMLLTRGLEVEVRVGNDIEPIREETRLILYEAARKLLENVAKHAKCDKAQVEIVRTPSQNVQLTVSDEGAGFNPDDFKGIPSDSFGLFSIRELAELMGGRLVINSAPGRGSRISLTVPA